MWGPLLLILIVGLALLLALAWARRRMAEAGAVTGGAGAPSVRLAQIRPAHRAALARITAEPDTMAAVGNGRPWDRRRLDNFLKYTAQEQAESPATRQNFYWAVEAGGELAGVVGFHPTPFGPDPQHRHFVTIFLGRAHRGRGVGAQALALAVEQLRELLPAARATGLAAYVRADNAASLRLHERLGFARTGCRQVGRPPATYVLLERPLAG